jgi:hypothetical protein
MDEGAPMQDSSDLVVALRRRGATLRAESGELRVSAPRGALTPADVDRLRLNKPGVVQFLLQESELLSGVAAQPRPITGPLPLTAMQRRHWTIMTNTTNGLAERSCKIAHHIIGPLDIHALRAAVHAIVQRHDALRLRFVSNGDSVEQYVDAAWNGEVELVDLGLAASTADHAADVLCLCEQSARAKIDLRTGPLFAAKLIRLSALHHVLLILMDHLISDAVSCAIVAEEVWAGYHNGLEQLPTLLPKLCVQFTDYAVWQDRTHQAWRVRHEPYWSQRLAMSADDPASVCREWSEAQLGETEMRSFTLEAALLGRLRNLSQSRGRLLAITVLATCVAALARSLNRPDLMLALVSNGRDLPQLQNIVGFLADALYLRLQTHDDETFTDLLERVAFEFQCASEHRDFGHLLDQFLDCQPTAVFNWPPSTARPMSVGSAEQLGTSLTIRPFRIAVPQQLNNRMYMAFVFEETPAHLTGRVFYRPGVFPTQTIERLVRTVTALAEEVSLHPDNPLSSMTVR